MKNKTNSGCQMKWTFILIIFLAIQCTTKSQFVKSEDKNTERWDVYLAQYEDGPGSTTLNMNLINRAPVKEFPFIVVTGVTYKNGDKDGFPLKEEFNNLYRISDSILQVISTITKREIAGTFTHKSQRMDYVYVRDTVELRKKLTEVYERYFNDYKYSIRIREDKNWDAYLKFLYPNEETMEYMSNEKVVMNLVNSGDNLTKPRQVDHWIYFANAGERNLYKTFAETQGYKTEGESLKKETTLPYELHISRIDYVKLDAICKITIELRRKAKELHGEYDGWETFVVKD